jgi:hypothetical protein
VARKKLIDEVGTTDKELQTSFVNNTEIIDSANKTTDDDSDIVKKEKSKKEEVEDSLFAIQNKGKTIAENIKSNEGKGIVPNSLRRKVS